MAAWIQSQQHSAVQQLTPRPMQFHKQSKASFVENQKGMPHLVLQISLEAWLWNQTHQKSHSQNLVVWRVKLTVKSRLTVKLKKLVRARPAVSSMLLRRTGARTGMSIKRPMLTQHWRDFNTSWTGLSECLVLNGKNMESSRTRLLNHKQFLVRWIN